jgi:hypothetical protein
MMIMMMPSSKDFRVPGICPLEKGEEGILILHSSTKKAGFPFCSGAGRKST